MFFKQKSATRDFIWLFSMKKMIFFEVFRK